MLPAFLSIGTKELISVKFEMKMFKMYLMEINYKCHLQNVAKLFSSQCVNSLTLSDTYMH